MASKSKRRGRVFRASCILAALIIAGSSFAWFTSKDEVTNRLSANADYDVSIVESFAPPKNFLPGQEVNKDVYATNTGSIGAFVEEKVTTKLAIVSEVDLNTTLTDGKVTANRTVEATPKDVAITDCVELTKDEYYSVEAGSYLAYRPTASAAKVGDLIVIYPDASPDPALYIKNNDYTTVITQAAYDKLAPGEKSSYTKIAETMYKSKTSSDVITKTAYDILDAANKATYVEMSFKSDFTPDVEGLYVFRRSIDVLSGGEEFFTYEGYYFKDGKYYKVNNIVVTPDNLIDLVYDGEYTDGQLTTATANLVYEKKDIVVPTLSYDDANNRLVATYERGYAASTLQSDLETKAKTLDEAEHALATARAQLQRALQDSDTSDANVTKYKNSVTQLENELEDVKARIAELEALIGYQPNTTTSTTPDKTGIEKQIENVEKDRDDAKDALDKTTTGSEGALTLLYGSGTGKNTFHKDAGTGKYVADFNDQASTYSVDGANGTTVITQAIATTAQGATSADALYYKYLQAMEDLRALKSSYGDDMFTAYVAELKEAFKNDATVLAALNAATTYDDVVAIPQLNWDQLSSINFVGTGAYDASHLHRINEYTYKLMKAKEEYDEQKTKADNQLAKYTNAMNALGDAGATSTANGGGTDVKKDAGTTTVAYDTKSVSGQSGLYGDKATLIAELDTAKNKKAALLSAIGDELINEANAQTVGGTTKTAAENLATAKTNYNKEYADYKKALDEYNNAKTVYENCEDLKIYINLSDDVVTYGGVANKWQLLPTALDDGYINATGAEGQDTKKDTATFYWTGILQPGKTSEKLIDSVELDKDTTQNMYKSFDFDIDVSLKSAQVTYDEAGNVLSTAALDELDATGVTITDPANEKTTALTWS